MTRRGRGRWILLAVTVLLVAGVWLTPGAPRPTPTPAGSFSFAALGDAPYFAWEEWRFRFVLRSINEHDVSAVVHVGDIFWRPCSDDHYRLALGRLNSLRHPVIYTPGDNEWADCWEKDSGGFPPLDRLASLRRIFYADPAKSAGGRPIALVSQGGSAAFPEFVEHARWTMSGVVFVTVHLIGSGNGLDADPKRTPEELAEARRRTEAAAAWISESFAAATASAAPAVVIAFHGTLGLYVPPGHQDRQAYEPFLATLEEEAARFGRPVLIVHGDDHKYTVDHPVADRRTGKTIDNLTRLEVPGSPDVGWVRVVVTPGGAQPFAFTRFVVPAWKYW
jgi:hypothetical protein